MYLLNSVINLSIFSLNQLLYNSINYKEKHLVTKMKNTFYKNFYFSLFKTVQSASVNLVYFILYKNKFKT